MKLNRRPAGDSGETAIPGFYIFVNAESVEACLFSKADGMKLILADTPKPLIDTAVIGDGDNDLPFLLYPGVGIRSAPSNAGERVLESLSGLDGSIVCSKPGLDGFLEFYQTCKESHISHIITDRDGVLMMNRDISRGPQASRLFSAMSGVGSPVITILTGTSVEQNQQFMAMYGLDNRLRLNTFVRENPYRLYCENGAFAVDVIDGRVRDFSVLGHPSILWGLKRDFEPTLFEYIDREVLPVFRLHWGRDREDNEGALFMPTKKTMVTVNLPREGSAPLCGHGNNTLKKALLDIMGRVAKEYAMPYRIL